VSHIDLHLDFLSRTAVRATDVLVQQTVQRLRDGLLPQRSTTECHRRRRLGQMAGEYERICPSQGGRLNLHSRTRRGKESSLAEFPPARWATAHGFEHAGPHGDRRVSCWVTLFGLRFRGKQRTLKDYFLADNTIPWWAMSLSIVAAETSTLTIISVPGLAYEKDFRFLQLVVGYMAGRIFVSALFIPSISVANSSQHTSSSNAVSVKG
jgi:hypothetical protein